jgi:hypothetical protein
MKRIVLFLSCLLFVFPVAQTSAQAQSTSCWATAFGPECASGLPSTAMDQIWAPQATPVWCWAASLQMVMQYYGADITQQEIVENVFHQPVPPVTTLPLQLIPQYLNMIYVNHAGHQYEVRSQLLTPVLQAVLPPLQANRPLLVFTSHHVMVLTALYYWTSPVGQPINTALAVVRDPWPYPYPVYYNGATGLINPGRRQLPLQEFADIHLTYFPLVYDRGLGGQPPPTVPVPVATPRI